MLLVSERRLELVLRTVLMIHTQFCVEISMLQTNPSRHEYHRETPYFEDKSETKFLSIFATSSNSNHSDKKSKLTKANKLQTSSIRVQLHLIHA